MKKLILFIALASVTTVASAQDMMSKKGTPILPEKGDWSLGIDVVPFFDYLGNMMNGSTSNSSPQWDFNNSRQAIFGRYVLDGGKAYRGSVRLALGSDVFETSDTTASVKRVKQSTNAVILSLGMQQSRGKGRLHGYYGAEGMIGFGGGKTENEYNGTPANTAVTEEKLGFSFMIGVRGFIGAEYFFAPKISLSGEFGWGLALETLGEGTTTYYNSPETNTPKLSSFGIDTDNGGGSIGLNFYF